MTLGTSNITMTLIRDTLVEATLKLSELCLSSNINKWSRKKPVRGTFPSAGDGNYGIDLVNNWGYLRPRGLANAEGYRIGDFRGYEHVCSVATKSLPPIHVLTAEFENADIYPYGGGNSANISRIRCYRTEEDNANGILPSHFANNLDNYYYGLKYTNSNGTFYKTYGLVSSLTVEGVAIAFNGTITETTPGADDWHFTDLPQGLGSAIGSFIICSSACPAWTQTAPATVYLLPSGTFSGISFSSGGSFTVHPWLIPSTETYTWDGYTEEAIELTIKCEVGSVFGYDIATLPDWISIDIGYWSGEPAEWTSLLTTPSQWTTGRVIRLTPDAPISTPRSGVLDLQIGGVTLFDVELSQDEEHVLPVASVVATGFNAGTPTATVTLGLTALSYAFTPNVSGNATFSLWLDGHIVSGTTFTDLLESSTRYSGVYTLPTAAAYDEVYEVRVAYPAT